ncbi:MAG: hypothetical protein WHS64_03350 [Fervidobacterium sp.]|uniref:hypothetical protein n=1 Tax=Fervidobacterium sp. TaxID=1871331 RepID=UPI0030A2B042
MKISKVTRTDKSAKKISVDRNRFSGFKFRIPHNFAPKLKDIFKKNYLYVLEFIVGFFIIWFFHRLGILSFEISLALLFSFVLVWSARYGLITFVIAISLFQTFLILDYPDSPGGIINYLGESVISVSTIILGLIIGVIGEILNNRISDLKDENRKLEIEKNKLIEALENMRFALSQLQMRIYFEGEGLIVLLERLRELEILDVDEIFTRAVEIIADFFELESLHFYRIEDNFLRYVAGVGKKQLPNAFELKHSKVVEDAINNGYSTLPKIVLREEISSFEPWFAVSVGEKENAFGVFIVEEISVEKFSETFVKYVSSVAGWLYANARVVMEQEKIAEQNYKKEDGTWEETYYLKKKSVFQKRKEKFGIPYEELCIIYRKELHEIIAKVFRKSDILYATARGEYIVLKALLPVCDEQGRKRVMERIASKHEAEIC